MHILKKVLSFALPHRCVVTGKIVQTSNGLSPEGFQKLTFIADPYCHQCGAPLSFKHEACRHCYDESFAFHHARSVLVYDDYSKQIILQYKHGDRLSLTPVFAEWLSHYGRDVLSGADLLIPVPLHPKRLRQRFYNQAAELVKGMHKTTDIPFVLDGLIRMRPTLPQGHEAKHIRIQNMENAFDVVPSFQSLVVGKSIVIIDDVMTSGATLNACATALLPFNPKKVSVLTLAKVLLV